MSERPASWIRKIENAIAPMTEIPMWGSPPIFPWESFSANLGQIFNLDDLKVSPGKAEWVESEDLLSASGENPSILTIDVSPLGEKLYWVMATEDMKRLLVWMMDGEKQETFSDKDLQKGFYHFLALKAVKALDESGVFEDLSFKIGEDHFPKEAAYTVDVAIEQGGSAIWGRMIAPIAFQEAFKRHFSSKRLLLSATNLASRIELTLKLEAGISTLPMEDFRRVEVGDFLLLDTCSYNPETKKGTVQMTLESAPLFQVKLKDEEIKILDYAHTFQENPMNDEEKTPEEEEEEIVAEEPSAEEMPAVEGAEETPVVEGAEEAMEEMPEVPAPPFEVATPEMISPEKVPLTLTVEVARLKMSLEKLLQVAPGNVLELAVKPEQGIDLTLNGRKVARGELVQVGDLLGVKITEISK